jgi:4-amino-4-deoxy-L-arabinose transferase-like glycosyltransferase
VRLASRQLGRLGASGGAEIDGRELALLGAAVALGIAVRLAYVLATRHVQLAGDELEYDSEGLLIAHGHWFWTQLPYGILHAGAWKAPGYPAWVGIWYALLGHHPVAVRVAQIPLGVVTIVLTWALARRLFIPKVAIVAAFAVALYPGAWQYEELLYPEALATPLTLVALILILTGTPTKRRAIAAGALVGVTMLIRPSQEFVFLGALAAWMITIGWRRGIGLTALAVVAALVVISPWTIRNAVVMHGFVPISMQDTAAYGTFNAQAANDPVWPYEWRRDPPDAQPLFNPAHPLSDVTLRSKLLNLTETYVGNHPGSLFGAFFWNGLSRLWDVRRHSRSLVEVPFEGRSRTVGEIDLWIYDLLLPLALIGLWRARRRRMLVVGVLALALGASITFTVDAGTRYRAPLEPLIAMLACAGVLGAQPAWASSGRHPKERPAPAAAIA